MESNLDTPRVEVLIKESQQQTNKPRQQQKKRTGQPVSYVAQYQIPTRFSDIRGCIFQADDSCVVICDRKRCRIAAYQVETKSVIVPTYKCQGEPLAMTKIDDTQFAVTMADTNNIFIINMLHSYKWLSRMSPPWPPVDVKEIKGPRRPCGLAYIKDDKELVVQSRHGTITFMTLDGRQTRSIPLSGRSKDVVKHAEYIAYSPEHSVCYLSCVTLHKMVAIDLDGKIVFEYMFSNLKSPGVMDIGRDGDIYVCSASGNSVQRINPDGAFVEELLSSKNTLLRPSAISFSDIANTFAVACGRRNKNLVLCESNQKK